MSDPKRVYSAIDAAPAVLYAKTDVNSDDVYPLKGLSNGELRTLARPYGYGVAEGDIDNHIAWSKNGYNPSVDTATEDLWVVGGTFVFPPSASTMQIVSTNDGDAATGTGIQQVIVTYLDANYVEYTEVVALNGTTSVSTTALIYRVNNFRAYSIGTTGIAAGNIYIQTNALTISCIALGATRARNQAYTVPSNTTLYIDQARFSSIAKVAGADAVFTARCNYDDKRGVKVNFFMPFIEIGTQDGAINLPFTVPIKIPQTVDIKVSARTENNGIICTSALRGWLENG